MKNKKNIIEKINCHIIALMILMNAIQIIVAWDFGIIFNMWLEYILIIILFLINKFKMVNTKNIIIIGITCLLLAINFICNDTRTLRFYINEFLLFALPLLLIFLMKVELKTFAKTFFGYNVVNLILYLLLIKINPSKLTTEYMTFGFYAISSLVYVMIYAYYYKYTKTFIVSLLALPIVVINGNRGTIIIFGVALICMLLMNGKSIKRKVLIVAVLILIGININTIGIRILDFITGDLGIKSYSIDNMYRLFESEDTENTLGGRYNIYKEAAMEINSHPITGIGIAKFQDKYGYFPHNIFLDVYVTFGVIFGTAYLIYLGYLGVKLYKLAKNSTEVKILFIFMVANATKLLLSKTFIYEPTIWLYISLGNYMLYKNMENKEKEEKYVQENVTKT